MDIRRIAAIKDGDTVTGNRTKIKIVKNKVAAPFREAEFDIIYGEGISKEGDLIDMGVAQNMVEKSGSWYSYKGERIGQGRENATQFLKDNPDIREKLDTELRKALGLTKTTAQETPVAPVVAAAVSENGRTARRQRRLKGLLAAALLLLAPAFLRSADQLALPGYHFEFPRDHFAHPEYQTEWWYYTGNLATSAGRQFGFEVTFFRFHPGNAPDGGERNPVWDPSQIYIAHFVLTDINGQHFYHQERVNRRGPRLAGADEREREIWNGNWSARWLSFTPIRQELQAVSDNATLRLTLASKKPPGFMAPAE